MEYPKKFDVCPVCGSMERIIESEMKDEASKGHIRAGLKTGCIVTQTAIFDPMKTAIIAPREIPIIMARFDICADCGTLYCVEVEKGSGRAEPQVRKDDHKQYP